MIRKVGQVALFQRNECQSNVFCWYDHRNKHKMLYKNTGSETL